MTFNLLTGPFFPVRTRSGARRWVSFADLAKREGDEAPVAFAWPRSDFNAACFELAIGVAALALDLARPEDWHDEWCEPDGPEALADKIAPFVHAFAFLGEGPCFLQDLAPLPGDPNPVEALLIDTPGANGQKKNADLLTHGGRYPQLGLPAAAMALYTLQQFAPSGGAGNRTSMRGGGPMTCLVLPGAHQDGTPACLWDIVLANLPLVTDGVPRQKLERVFPWLAPTLTSGKDTGGQVIHENDPRVHPLQAFFGMPRRLRLVAGETEGTCAMTGETGPVVTGFVQVPYGVNYGLWSHPLTPYRRLKPEGEPYPAKPKSAHMGYRDWVSVTYGDPVSKTADPAQNVQHLLKRSAELRQKPCTRADPRLRIAGWAMSNMEAIAFLDSEQPLYLAEDEGAAKALAGFALQMAGAADFAAGLLRNALRRALFSENASVDTAKGLFHAARASFYAETESAFHQHLGHLNEDGGHRGEALRRWLHKMHDVAERLFDDATADVEANGDAMRRIADAASLMRAAFFGYGKDGKALFTLLDIAAPATAKTAKTGAGKAKGRSL
ncbi:MAG: type I-E CRISPR-associated protein Cse1/CasA [Hyphomicrobiaceae bacterium]|nr:type I-E CRISPR-associated protein Cse1/CasA [Hyphomicrobiaceae bacterium]